MELLNPSPPPVPAGNYFAGIRYDRSNRSTVFQSPEIIQEVEDRVHVAVGKSFNKTLSLLNWTFRQFGSREICLVHVHQPSPTIPTLLGNLPVSQVSEALVAAYHRDEREKTKKFLFGFMNVCSKAKVKASIVMIEAGQVQKGIVDMVNKHGIRKLVMGAVPENCIKVKNSSKASYAAKNAPPYCEIWFVNRGKLVWTREASENSTYLPIANPTLTAFQESSNTTHGHRSEMFNPAYLKSSSSVNGRIHVGVRSLLQIEPDQEEFALSTPDSTSTDRLDQCSNTSSAFEYSSFAERRVSSDSEFKVEEESFINQLAEVRADAEASNNEAFAELLKRTKLESEVAESINKVKAFEVSHAHENKLRKEIEDALRMTRQEKESLIEERETVMRELQKTMRNVAVLNSCAREATYRRDEAAGELKLIQASLATVRLERQKIRRQTEEAVRRLEWWRNRGQVRNPNFDGFIRFVHDSPEFAEFSLLDLETATCNFSESFKIGQGGCGCVYKGEMLDRSVAIKKLHPHNMQGQSEFQQEVQVLSKLRHPHLVTLIGACPEAWSLVYEYLPNGSLQNRLFQKSNTPPLTWKIRTRIVASISSALLFLHTSKPEKIVHGDLKPENILLDSELNCKIGDFGICRLLPEETMHYPSFCRNTGPKGAFPYMDPELHRTGDMTPKSDIYSFGIIILQVLTGRPPVGLVSEVRRALLYGNLASILDTSAGEWPTFVSRRLVELGLECCELNSRDRIELTPAVVRELDRLHVSEERPVPSFFLCPILQEIMHDPQVAADGFTYEGEALRGWLENGRKTSPMTNLELSHLCLTPNHALRRAIREWLCQA